MRTGLPPSSHGPKVTAIGGGHGLAATLSALQRVTDSITAVVGVSDDGGSSGRLRHELGVLPPGDLRMALAALCGGDTWGRTWSRVVQHRFGGDGELRGHSLGNLLITSLWEETGDVVVGLDWVAALLGARGRVLPVSTVPLEIVASVRFPDDSETGRLEEVRGQVAVATTSGQVEDVGVIPRNPPACPEAVDAIRTSQTIILGPGSWFTSVMAPLLVPELRAAIIGSDAQVVVVLNLVPQSGETSGYTAARYVEVLTSTWPDLPIDTVLVDPRSIADESAFHAACRAIGATALIRRVSTDRGMVRGIHDPDLLAAAFAEITGRGRIGAWH